MSRLAICLALLALFLSCDEAEAGCKSAHSFTSNVGHVRCYFKRQECQNEVSGDHLCSPYHEHKVWGGKCRTSSGGKCTERDEKKCRIKAVALAYSYEGSSIGDTRKERYYALVDRWTTFKDKCGLGGRKRRELGESTEVGGCGWRTHRYHGCTWRYKRCKRNEWIH